MNTGLTFFGLLALLLIGLKLDGAIEWSWWWVLAPLWGPPAAALAISILILIGAAVIDLHNKRQSR